MSGRSSRRINEPEPRNYCKIAADYCRDVLSGKIPACTFVKQACQRQIDDLARDWEFAFDKKKAEMVCRFIEKLPHVKGSEWSGRRIVLEPWQVFILTTAFGWVDSAGKRRYRVVYVEVPRKNGKSFLSAGVGLYCLRLDGEVGAEVVTAATKADQARIVLDMARMMVKKTPALQQQLGLEAREHVILRAADASSFRALSKDHQGSQDGQNISCAIVDELHAHKSRDMWAALDTATGARSQPLIWTITTAGSNRAGICYEQRDYVKKILGGEQDDRTFGIIYTIDEGDAWDDEATWRKANPNYGVSVNPDDLKRKAAKAMKVASAQNEFLTKHLNVWVNASQAWMNMPAWEACSDTSLTAEMFHGEPCIAAYDLASKNDFAVNVKLFVRDNKYYVIPHFYLPEETIENSANAAYSGWKIGGFLEAHDGGTINFDIIEEELIEDCNNFEMLAVPYDKFQAFQFAQHMIARGIPMVEYGATVLNFSEAMKTVESLVAERRIVHDGNPIMTWMMSNVVAKVDAKDNIFPRKEFPQNKIDGPVALIMAIGVQLKREIETEAYLDTNPVIYVE